MDRLLSFILGGLALALYAPYLFLGQNTLIKYQEWWIDFLGNQWFEKIFRLGPGVFAGLALLLLAIRSTRD
jgi:hypothetical protein